METVKEIWDDLGNVPVNIDDEIDEDFHIKDKDITFEKGTDKFEIWHWIEDTYNVRIVDLLYPAN
jgi:hypothetical protein